jgi:hypothetical protein
VWKCDSFLQIRDRILLPSPNLIEFSVTNERIGDVSKGSLNRLPVRDQNLLFGLS